MLPVLLRRRIYDLQERRQIVRVARAKIGALIGDDAVIEIGCGFGPNSRYCKGPYLGIDIDPEAIWEAKRQHPTKAFLVGDATTLQQIGSEYNTVLFSAVLHEISDYRGALDTVSQADIHRILICDYDPQLGGWLRWWMNLFEPGASRWWGCQPTLFFPVSDWSVQNGQITQSLLWWEFRRKRESTTTG